ncbi:hypothetical protein RB620_04440 [Paenibacillus sp. LHD-117]|uniref:portal protein n=1 Tax=Paenibacillus sp. LHD-117 TaxID=3071412 RepID=UPI0027E05FAC|nr:hypothetical protein [Paenibacillus sp. LHD-117]MDQ6418681.1 hypothetical protein [Paenibacillus sp. LHD-117]
MKSMGYLINWPKYERFKAGDQWPAPTERTRNLPRPVFNIIDLIESLKVSTVMNEQIMMRFTSSDSGTDLANEAADMFTKYSDTVWEEIQQNDLNEQMLEIAANVGSGILHYYWDSGIKGGNVLKYEGKICGEVLDPINVFFGNPQSREVQSQPYILISYRENTKKLRKEATANKLSKTLISMIGPDKNTADEGYDMAQVEINDDDKTTALLCYYRHDDGFIHFHKVASGMVIKPDTNSQMRKYPIALMPWKRRRKSIHGIGDTQGIIENQKAINFMVAMALLSGQLTGWPKMAIDPMRVDKRKITNTPGEIIDVKNAEKGLNTAVAYLNPGNISPHVMGLVDTVIDLTRSMTSANDASTGEAPGANMSAAALIQLQRANGVPIESVKRRFYKCMEDVGRIWEEFFKVRYNLPREVKVKDDDGDDDFVQFDGSKYADTDLDLKIDIGPSSMFSEALMMSSLDRFLDQKFITFDQYLKYAPNNVVPFKARLTREIESLREQQATQPTPMADPLASLSPEQRAQFDTLPPEQQKAILQQAQQMG